MTVPLGQHCPTCGQTHTKCRGHNKRGAPCGQGARAGQEVCRNHGGDSPQARAAAERRRIEAEALRELRRRWQDDADIAVTDPLAELARVAGEVVAFKDMLREQVQSLSGVLTYWSDREVFAAMSDEEMDSRVEQTEQLRAVVTAYERAQERAAKILAAMVKLDIAGRMLELRTTQAEQIVTAVRDGLATVDMEQAIRTAALTAIADRLDQITEQQTPPKELTA